MKHPRVLLLSFALALACHAAAADPGEPDLRFSDDGVAFVATEGASESVQALVPDADNAVFAAASLYETVPGLTGKGRPLGYDMGVVRLLGDGSVDPSWGTEGYARIGVGGDEEGVNDMVRLPDGSLLVAGALERGTTNADFGVARFTPQGFPDELFGEYPTLGKGVAPRRGAVAFNVGPDATLDDWAVGLAVQSTGRIVVVGSAYSAADANGRVRIGIARLTPEGQLDDSFPGHGWFLADPFEPDSFESVFAIARRSDDTLTADDGFVVVGMAGRTQARAMLRRFRADGTPDPEFGTDGTVMLEAGTGDAVHTGLFRIMDAVIDPRGRIVVVGNGNDRGFAFMRFNPDGSVDRSFGVDGRQHVRFGAAADIDTPFALKLQADGKIVAAGEAVLRTPEGEPSSDFASVRLLRNGAIDSGYGDGGGRSLQPISPDSDSAAAVAITSDGSVLLAGRASVETGGQNMAFLRLQGGPTVFADDFED
jgi:uncharacterized delta-60 repeat protein